jgi:hypothetical protein
MDLRQHTVRVTIAEGSVSAVYLPPSMSDDACVEALNYISQSDLVMGDFNVRYPHLYPDIASGSAESRRDSIDDWAEHNDLEMTISSRGIPNVDHVFGRHSEDTAVEYTAPLYAQGNQTTHGVLRTMWTRRQPVKGSTTPKNGAKRYFLKHLDDIDARTKLQRLYKSRTSAIENVIEGGTKVVKTHSSLAARQRRVDACYDFFIQQVDEIVTKAIGEYKPEEFRHKKVDRTAQKLRNFRGGRNTLLRMIKKAHRTTRTVPLQSRTDDKSPEEDAISFMEEIYQTRGQASSVPTWEQETNTDWKMIETNVRTIGLFFKEYNDTKSGGKDGLHTKLIQALGEGTYFFKHIRDLYNLFSSSGATPTAWNLSIVNPIPKGHEGHTIDLQRPVSLTAMLRRCYENIILTACISKPVLKEALKVNFAQAGFQPHQSTILHTIAAHEHQVRTHGTQIFIDLKQAYDRVDLDLLFQKLTERGVPTAIRTVLFSLFAHCRSQIAVNGGLSETFERYTGIFQGSLLAPMLWNVYIDDLATIINGSEAEAYPHALFFADDIKLQYRPETQDTLIQMHLDIISQWCIAHNMKPGINKCGIIHAPGRNRETIIAFTLADQLLPEVDSYKYLGFEMTQQGIDWRTYTDRVANKAVKTLKMLKAVGYRWRASLKVVSYKTFVRSTLEYGASLLHHWINGNPVQRAQRISLTDKFKAIQEEAIRWIFRMHSSAVVTKTHESLAAILTVENRLLQLATTLTTHLERAPRFHPAICLLETEGNVRPIMARYILPHCKSTSWFVQYQVKQRQLTELNGVQLTLGTWVKKRAKEEFMFKSGMLARYCNEDGRTDSGMDYTLDIRDNAIAQKAIKWRLNKCHLWKCRCGGTLARNHIDECPAMTTAPLDPDVRARCEQEMGMQHHVIERMVDASYHYSLMDQMLNLRLFEDFGRVMDYLNQDVQENDDGQILENLDDANNNDIGESDGESLTSDDGSEALEALLLAMDQDDKDWDYETGTMDNYEDGNYDSDTDKQGNMWDFME